MGVMNKVMQLKNTYGVVIFEANVQSMKELVELAVSQGISLANANLTWADLTNANLPNANLTNANLPNANLTDANLPNANLTDANLTDANLTNANLTNANLINANLINANLTNANLTRANLFYANLSYANLSYANLSYANLSYANLTCANLFYANLSYANLSYANLSYANLSYANLTDCISLRNRASNFLFEFKQTRSGIYVYKAIGRTAYPLNPKWVIKPGQYIEETVDRSATNPCGCGVNFGTLEYIQKHYPNSDHWLCLIEWIDVADVVVPYNIDGRARCERLKLMRKIK